MFDCQSVIKSVNYLVLLCSFLHTNVRVKSCYYNIILSYVFRTQKGLFFIAFLMLLGTNDNAYNIEPYMHNVVVIPPAQKILKPHLTIAALKKKEIIQHAAKYY